MPPARPPAKGKPFGGNQAAPFGKKAAPGKGDGGDTPPVTQHGVKPSSKGKARPKGKGS